MTSDLALWSALERRYDGPIPEDALTRARWGLERGSALERADGRRLMWASQARRQIQALRQARRIAGAEAHQLALAHELIALLLNFRGANRDYWRLRRLNEETAENNLLSRHPREGGDPWWGEMPP